MVLPQDNLFFGVKNHSKSFKNHSKLPQNKFKYGVNLPKITNRLNESSVEHNTLNESSHHSNEREIQYHKKITKRKIKRETKHFPYVIMIHQGVRYEEDNYFSESLIE